MRRLDRRGDQLADGRGDEGTIGSAARSAAERTPAARKVRGSAYALTDGESIGGARVRLAGELEDEMALHGELVAIYCVLRGRVEVHLRNNNNNNRQQTVSSERILRPSCGSGTGSGTCAKEKHQGGK